MAVENPQFINEFNVNWPDGLDPKSQGDDHIRNIKAALKRTFPKITGATQVTQQDLDKLVTPGTTNIPGMIMMWAGTVANIPAGWKLCNGVGTTSNGLAIPDLRDRFPIGAGANYALRATGGTTTHTHTATTSVAGHALTLAQMPAHTHDLVRTYYDGTNGTFNDIPSDSPNRTYVTKTGSAGGNQAHSHGATTSVAAVNHLPPYCGVFFIIKD